MQFGEGRTEDEILKKKVNDIKQKCQNLARKIKNLNTLSSIRILKTVVSKHCQWISWTVGGDGED